MNSAYKKIVSVGIIFSVVMTFIQGQFFEMNYDVTKSDIYLKENTAIPQKSQLVKEIVPIKKMYYKDHLIGIVNNLEWIKKEINNVGSQRYQDVFPDEELGFSEDIYIAEDIAYTYYENIDQKIVDYLIQEDLLAVEVNRIEFSNGAVIYASDLDQFEEAKQQFLLNFIEAEDLNALKNNELPILTTEYGSIPTGLEVLEKTVISKGFASIEDIMVTKQDFIEFFSYGFDKEPEIYVVEEYDTVEGVASKNGLTTQQLLTINPQLESPKQLLKEGLELNVKYFKSPLNVVVKKNNTKKEIIYPDEPLYVKDNSLAEGKTKVTVEEQPGSRKVVYSETHVNGVLQDGAKEISSQVLVEPVREVVKVGTYVEPRVGSGSFRYPVNNVSISCGWYCYAGHTAIDVQNSANFYGEVRASDRGVVIASSYTGINGNYVEINHNNGYVTYYGHMHTAPYVQVGDVVAKGEVIGQIGMTGLATGPHVHFEIRRNGTRLNPCTLLGC